MVGNKVFEDVIELKQGLCPYKKRFRYNTKGNMKDTGRNI
jgi:hypothetical protein